VEIAFRTRKLQRQYERSADAMRAYGQQVGRKYIARINLMKQARDIDEIGNSPACSATRSKGIGQASGR